MRSGAGCPSITVMLSADALGSIRPCAVKFDRKSCRPSRGQAFDETWPWMERHLAANPHTVGGYQSRAWCPEEVRPLQLILVCEIEEIVSGGVRCGPDGLTPRSIRRFASGPLRCQNRPGFGTYVLTRRSLAAKSIFRFYHFGEKLIGLSGGSSSAPPQATHVPGKKPDPAHDTDGQCDAHSGQCNAIL